MKMDTSMNKKIIIGTLMGCFLGATVGYSASVMKLPHTFVAGMPIKASEVNANFSALAQEIASIKQSAFSDVNSSDYMESQITSMNLAAGTIVNVGGDSYEIKEKANVVDFITGKKYKVAYPESKVSSGLEIYAANCLSVFGENLRVHKAVISGVDVNLFLKHFYSNHSDMLYTSIGIQASKNICLRLILDSTSERDAAVARKMIDDSKELLKYISVSEQ